MNMSPEMLIKSYLSNIQVNLIIAAHTHCPDDWQDIDYIPDYSKLYYICEGEGWLKIGDTEIYPKPGQLCLMPAGMTQSYSVINGNTFVKYWCHFTATIGEVNLFEVMQLPYYIDIPDKTGMDALFSELVKAYDSNRLAASIKAKSVLLHILAYYMDSAAVDGLHLKSTEQVEKLLEVIRYVDGHLPSAFQ